ncbi:MAG: RNA polymerase sigma factor SigA [Microgenomates group bacterium ADurb.Bin238]|jgi:DNA-directed RNA polymerase sigma subunit (sigma70/sigma32)|nr:MAG: RNA polymerase sigma factor SigA [Microgenomates group bacterium ADurb.Bin238]
MSLKLLSRAQEKELINRYRTKGDLVAFDQLANDGVRLSLAIAKRYSTNNTFLVLHGFIGWCKALTKYKLNSRYKLSVYATWWIDQEIRIALGLPLKK